MAIIVSTVRLRKYKLSFFVQYQEIQHLSKGISCLTDRRWPYSLNNTLYFPISHTNANVHIYIRIGAGGLLLYYYRPIYRERSLSA